MNAAEEQDALRFIAEVLEQKLASVEGTLGKAVEKAQRALSRQQRQHAQQLEASETKHAAYTQALTSQMKEGLLAAVKQCKVLERELAAERAARAAAEDAVLEAEAKATSVALRWKKEKAEEEEEEEKEEQGDDNSPGGEDDEDDEEEEELQEVEGSQLLIPPPRRLENEVDTAE